MTKHHGFGSLVVILLFDRLGAEKLLQALKIICFVLQKILSRRHYITTCAAGWSTIDRVHAVYPSN